MTGPRGREGTNSRERAAAYIGQEAAAATTRQQRAPAARLSRSSRGSSGWLTAEQAAAMYPRQAAAATAAAPTSSLFPRSRWGRNALCAAALEGVPKLKRLNSCFNDKMPATRLSSNKPLEKTLIPPRYLPQVTGELEATFSALKCAKNTPTTEFSTQPIISKWCRSFVAASDPQQAALAQAHWREGLRCMDATTRAVLLE
ncbi:hypothetical protein Esti_004167 [Eimeria stiedai]